MRIATKYCMEAEQTAIADVVQSNNYCLGISGAISILCFIAEFPEHFSEDDVQDIFVQACSTGHYPSAKDLGRLMAYPDLLVAMMKYREGQLRPETAVWRPKPIPKPQPMVPSMFPPIFPSIVTPMETWLAKELKSLGLTK
jgi:hypothetical protein